MSTMWPAAAEIARGRMVVVRGCAGYGGIVFAAAHSDVEKMAFLIRHSCGFVCVALPPARCDDLRIPPMYPSWRDGDSSAFCVTVDARWGTTTGISAADRALTARRLADPASMPADFVRPGHVVPVATSARAAPAGARLSQAAVAVTRTAKLAPLAVFGHLVSPVRPTQLATDDELADFAAAHRLAVLDLDVADPASGSSRRTALSSG